MDSKTATPTTPRAAKRSTEEQLTDVMTKLLAKLEDSLANMKSRKQAAEDTIQTMDSVIPALEKKIAAQRLALGIDQPADK